jgi:predicted transcriptional regulator of viral defense system
MTSVGRTIWKEILPVSPVFTTAEVAHAAGVQVSNASRDLAHLEDDGMIVRIRRGLWGVPHHPDFSPYAVVPHLFSGGETGYVSLLSALNLHGMIEQIPRTVQVVTTRQRADLETPVARYEFHKIQADLFGGFGPYRGMGSFDIATPAKAFVDVLYLSMRKGQRFAHLPEVEFTEAFSWAEMRHWVNRIDLAPLRAAVRERWTAIEKSVA